MAVDVASHFEAGLDGWQARLQADEWYFASLRMSLVDALSPAEAFNQVGEVVALVLRQRDAFLCAEAAQLLVTLARKSDTTEMPSALDREWRRLVRHLSSSEGAAGAARELESWYRR